MRTCDTITSVNTGGGTVKLMRFIGCLYDYYGRLFAYCRELGLPICCRGPQWEEMLVKREYWRGVSIVVPGFGDITVDVPRGGAFYLVDGGDGSIKPVAAALGKSYSISSSFY